MTAAGLSVLDDARNARVQRARDTAVAALLSAREGRAWWTGELSASALSTATAVTALTMIARGDPATAERLRAPIRRGYAWLIRHQNRDGGWGDTTRSISNISTTALVWAALGLWPEGEEAGREAEAAAERWLGRAAGSVEPDALVEAIERRYGDDRTFSIPILTMCALCGRLGPAQEAWGRVRQLPFEVAALPQAWFGALRLPVVSYALPALIAIGQVRHGLHPTRNPLLRWLRDRCRARTLEKLAQLQPENGGFLEAAPLTSFVVMSLGALGNCAHPVVQRGVAFLEASIREDGSWPIDTHLATWVTTLSVNALAVGDGPTRLPGSDQIPVRDWLLRQQYRHTHPYTLARPGGWAWTDLPGGVPDADDTAGAIVALCRLDGNDAGVREAAHAGTRWLLGLQNRDGGIPTFCRGWGRLPFDRSSPDITAHALRAWLAAESGMPEPLRRAVQTARRRAIAFLLRTQLPDGTWIPLWFGHQEHPEDANPLYGTTRVLLALAGVVDDPSASVTQAIERGLTWLMAQQNADGGWSGAAGAESSVEETGLAVETLAATWSWVQRDEADRGAHAAALSCGADWLAAAVIEGRFNVAAPIGFYFAKLWYFERLYPLIFATGALTRLGQCGSSGSPADRK